MIFPLSATSRSFSSSFSFCSSRSLSLSSKRQLWASLSAFCSSLTSPSRFASSCSILCFSLCWSLQLSILRSSSFLSSSNVPVKGERVCAGREVDGQRTPVGGWKRGPRVSLTNAFPVMLDELLRRRKVVEEGFVCKVESRHLCRLAVRTKGLRGRSSSSWAGCGPPLTPVALGRNQPPPDRVLSPELRIEGVSEGFKKKETTFPTSFPKIVSFFFFFFEGNQGSYRSASPCTILDTHVKTRSQAQRKESLHLLVEDDEDDEDEDEDEDDVFR